jgi:hypothetical protein
MKWIEIKYLPHAFWTCQGIGIRFRVSWWRAAFVLGIPDWFANIISRLTSACTLTDGDSAVESVLSTPEGGQSPEGDLIPPIGK